jgi:hypothetical protein
MKGNPGGEDSRHEAEIEETIRRLEGEFRELLSARAGMVARGGVESKDLEAAFEILTGRHVDKSILDAQAIVSQALRENRVFEWLSYAMALSLFVLGIILVGVGIFAGKGATYGVTSIVGGAVFELLIIMPFRFIINSRKHNIAIRMLGILLDKVEDPKKLAALLQDTFLAVVMGKMPAGPKAK